MAEAIGSKNTDRDPSEEDELAIDSDGEGLACNSSTTSPGNREIHHRSLDVSLITDEGEGRPPYEAEAFWTDLLLRSTSSSESPSLAALYELGTLFQTEKGVYTEDAKEFVEEFTPFDSLREAHWTWAQNAAFEGDLPFPDGTYGDRCDINFDVFNSPLTLAVGGGPTSLDLGQLDRYSASIIEITFANATPDPIEVYEVSWSGSKGKLYTNSMEAGPDGECVDVAGEQLRMVDEHPNTGESSPNTAYLINSGSQDVNAYLLLQDDPTSGLQEVTVEGPFDYEDHKLEVHETSIQPADPEDTEVESRKLCTSGSADLGKAG